MSVKAKTGRAVAGGEFYREQARGALEHGGLCIARPGWSGTAGVEAAAQHELDTFRGVTGGRYAGLAFRNAPLCRSVFPGRTVDADFLLWRYDWDRPLALFVRSQEVSGSAEDKLAGLMLSLSRHSPLPCAVLLAGDHFTADSDAVRFVGGEAAALPAIFRHVFVGTGEFLTWVNHAGMSNPAPEPFLPTRADA